MLLDSKVVVILRDCKIIITLFTVVMQLPFEEFLCFHVLVFKQNYRNSVISRFTTIMLTDNLIMLPELWSQRFQVAGYM